MTQTPQEAEAAGAAGASVRKSVSRSDSQPVRQSVSQGKLVRSLPSFTYRLSVSLCVRVSV